ncbi:MAG: DUF4331 domain-containing protein [Gammaproteobacteria bacterium]
MKLHAIAVALAATALSPTTLLASSHREAPFITTQPKVDGTDFYMFMSYEPGRTGFVTLVADYLPLQDPYGGPNYFGLDPNALYEIHVDNNGDAHEDLTFQFHFTTTSKDTKLTVGGKAVSIPLINSGAISATDTSALNVSTSYSVDIVRGDRRRGTRTAITNADTGATSFAQPADNIGNKSIPNYPGYAAAHIYNISIPGCSGTGRLFVGQRKDPFVVNLGETFDLINTNPLGPVDGEKDSLADKNVTALELEVPASCLTAGSETVIGGWTTASMRQGRLMRPFPSYGQVSREGGPWVQVSRLGMPLVNEVVIGLKDKDKFNASKPADDAQFGDYVTNPTLPALIQLLYPSAPAPTNFPRNDLVTAFLTGVPGLNKPMNVTPSEMLRLNTKIPAAAKGSQNDLGVIAGDNAGFPNGRRPGDDVVDIALRVVMGKLCKLNIGCVPADAPAGDAPLTDGALVNDSMFDAAFPYLRTPLPGSPN